MAEALPNDLKQRVSALLTAGPFASEEEVLRMAVGALERQVEDREAIRAGIADMEAGRMRTLTDFDASYRQEKKILQS